MTERMALSRPVGDALASGRPVVALETSVLAQGLPPPRNLEAMDAMSEAIVSRGAEPAWTAVLGGQVRAGLDREDLVRLATDPTTRKVARRDLPAAVAQGGRGATTVSATLWIADRAGIQVAVTGGIGGIHRGTRDVSADLLELARTPGTLVCSGPKAIVDPQATMERLDELGVLVVGYRCDRVPFFVARETDIPLEHRADTPAAVGAIVNARRELGMASSLLVLSPVPADRALPGEVVERAVERCLRRAESEEITGKAVTPFLLAALAEETGGASLEANLALLASNAGVAADLASALS